MATIARWLLDTNVVIGWVDKDSADRQISSRVVDSLIRRDTRCCHLARQVLYEFWAVATRPRDHNGLGWTVERAHDELLKVQNLFQTLEDPPDLFNRWLALVTAYKVQGFQAHDMRLLALAQAYDLRLLTVNVRHFPEDFRGVVIHPRDLAAEL